MYIWYWEGTRGSLFDFGDLGWSISGAFRNQLLICIRSCKFLSGNGSVTHWSPTFFIRKGLVFDVLDKREFPLQALHLSLCSSTSQEREVMHTPLQVWFKKWMYAWQAAVTIGSRTQWQQKVRLSIAHSLKHGLWVLSAGWQTAMSVLVTALSQVPQSAFLQPPCWCPPATVGREWCPGSNVSLDNQCRSQHLPVAVQLWCRLVRCLLHGI